MRTRDLSRIEWVALVSAEPILDVGCGDSPYFDETVDFLGLDKSMDSDDMYRENPGDMVQGYATDLPFEDNRFRTVVLAEVLEHLDNPVGAIIEAKRVTGDRVIITVPDESRWHEDVNPGEHPDHKRQYHGKMLFDQCVKAGFTPEDVKIDYINDGSFAFWVAVCDYVPGFVREREIKITKTS